MTSPGGSHNYPALSFLDRFPVLDRSSTSAPSATPARASESEFASAPSGVPGPSVLAGSGTDGVLPGPKPWALSSWYVLCWCCILTCTPSVFTATIRASSRDGGTAAAATSTSMVSSGASTPFWSPGIGQPTRSTFPVPPIPPMDPPEDVSPLGVASSHPFPFLVTSLYSYETPISNPPINSTPPLPSLPETLHFATPLPRVSSSSSVSTSRPSSTPSSSIGPLPLLLVRVVLRVFLHPLFVRFARPRITCSFGVLPQHRRLPALISVLSTSSASSASLSPAGLPPPSLFMARDCWLFTSIVTSEDLLMLSVHLAPLSLLRHLLQPLPVRIHLPALGITLLPLQRGIRYTAFPGLWTKAA